MNTVFFHIYSNFPAKIVFFNNQTQILNILTTESLSDEISLEIKNLDSLKINVYPLNNKSLLAYTVKIENKNSSFKRV